MQKRGASLLIALCVSGACYADAVFEKVCSAVRIGSSAQVIQRLEERYAGKTITGEGYFFEIVKSPHGEPILSIFTEEDRLSPHAVAVSLFVKGGSLDRALGLVRGDEFSFSGTFHEIRTNGIVIYDAEVR
jgi:hypothetical protein